jgi:manganese-transporting P-type ATPase
MSALIEAKYQTEKIHDYFAVCKGAPEILEKLLSTVPENYEKMYKEYVTGGYRVLALAYRQIKDISEHNLKAMKREEVEKDLTFAGFLIFECPIKKSSKKIVQELKNSGHLIKMITGDNILTAAHVAKEIEISNVFNKVLFIEMLHEKFVFGDYDGKLEKTEITMKNFSAKDLKEVCSKAIVCMNGSCLTKL